ncbi:hypothetical protein D3C81_2206260 [compost metagenome]
MRTLPSGIHGPSSSRSNSVDGRPSWGNRNTVMALAGASRFSAEYSDSTKAEVPMQSVTCAMC